MYGQLQYYWHRIIDKYVKIKNKYCELKNNAVIDRSIIFQHVFSMLYNDAVESTKVLYLFINLIIVLKNLIPQK